MITVSDSALAQARLLKKMHPEWQNKGLRIWISDKNCDGFMYGVAFDAAIDGDIQIQLDDLIVLLDSGTGKYVEDSVVDYVNDERGQGFIVQNPKATNYRGKFFLKSS